MRSLFKRFREPIFVVGLLAFTFGVFFVKAKKGRELNAVERLIVSLTAPAERAIVAAANGVVDVWHDYAALRGVRAENNQLRRDGLRSKNMEQANAELKLENDRLRRLLDFADRKAPVRMLPAQVVAVGASPHSHTLRIHLGEKDGLRRGDPVIAQEGVVGTVISLTARYADVQLIINPLSAVAAVSERTRSRSTVKGTGDFAKCKLDYGLRTDDVQEGDVLVSAFYNNADLARVESARTFPAGLRIGTVTNVRRAAAGMFLQAEVIPAVNFAKLDEVLVLVEQPGTDPGVASARGVAP